ncbi:MAG TPA: DUF305 domain-containing protein [bacterium]|nr:DUF305 domain-containing protein [bacterium]
MESSMKEMMEEMKQKSGEEFDQAFLEAMIIHHQQAVDMAEMAAGQARDPRVKEFAEDIIEDQREEIEEMKEVRDEANV